VTWPTTVADDYRRRARKACSLMQSTHHDLPHRAARSVRSSSAVAPRQRLDQAALAPKLGFRIRAQATNQASDR